MLNGFCRSSARAIYIVSVLLRLSLPLRCFLFFGARKNVAPSSDRSRETRACGALSAIPLEKGLFVPPALYKNVDVSAATEDLRIPRHGKGISMIIITTYPISSLRHRRTL